MNYEVLHDYLCCIGNESLKVERVGAYSKT